MHEMTEVMGRVGSVGKAIGSGAYTPLDLFGYPSTATSNSSGAQRATTAGGAADDFSIDGGLTSLGVYSAATVAAGDDAGWSTKELGDPFGDATYAAMPLTGADAIEMAAIGHNLTTNGKTLASTAQGAAA